MDLRHTKNDKMGKLNISVPQLFCMIFKSLFPWQQVYVGRSRYGRVS